MADQNKLHIVMLPWLAFGHMIPFLELSKNLAQRGHRISFVSTPKNIDRLPKPPPNLAPLIDFVKLSLPQVDGLPENAEATSEVSYEKIPYLKKAFDGLQPQLTHFLEISSPDWIIHDFAPHWLPSIASRIGVPCAFFYTFNASTVAFFGPPHLQEEPSRTKAEHFTVSPEWIPFPSDLAFRLHEVLRMFNGVDPIAAGVSGVSDTHRYTSTINGCKVIAVRSCIEFEAEWLNLLQRGFFQKPVLPIGLLPPETKVTGDVNDEADDRWIGIRDWLEKQKKESVVYIALGSEVDPSLDEINELALGLEQSGLPFFWVTKKSPGSTGFDSGLPSGFEERTAGQGFICRGWAPQLRILAHPSVGSFVTHCGWSSIIEASALGCSLILFPLLNDQPLNARLLQGKDVAFEIPRDERDGSLSRDSVAESLRIVMVEKAEFYKAKAREMKEIFGKKALHDQYVDCFAKHLVENGRQCSQPGRIRE